MMKVTFAMAALAISLSAHAQTINMASDKERMTHVVAACCETAGRGNVCGVDTNRYQALCDASIAVASGGDPAIQSKALGWCATKKQEGVRAQGFETCGDVRKRIANRIAFDDKHKK